MFKKIVVLGVMVVMVFSFVGCDNILKEFDQSDPKEFWNGSIDDDFADDRILLILRKTSTYPELELRHFKLNNAKSMSYLGGVLPPDYYFTPGHEEQLENYRQMVSITLKRTGKQKVVDAIKKLEKLGFVKVAGPSYIFDPA